MVKPLPALTSRVAPSVALIPMALVVLIGYLGAVLWSIGISMTNSRTFPSNEFVGLAQYVRLFSSDRWIESLQHLGIYGLFFVLLSMLIGFLLAVFIDQKVRAEGVLRTIYLYPYAMSFVATGLVWQWMFNPEIGIQHAMRSLGWDSLTFDWLVDQDMVMYTIVIATVWQAAGLVMALVLAGLRGIDEEIWKATRLDGIPRWRVYVSIVIPMLAPTLATTFILLFTSVVKLFDAVVAMTQGGPGLASEVPTKFIMDHLFGRANIALASAGAVMLLLMVIVLVVPFMLRARGRAPGGTE